jgi:hypothetical protein
VINDFFFNFTVKGLLLKKNTDISNTRSMVGLLNLREREIERERERERDTDRRSVTFLLYTCILNKSARFNTFSFRNVCSFWFVYPNLPRRVVDRFLVAFYIARRTRNVSGAHKLRNAKLACNIA